MNTYIITFLHFDSPGERVPGWFVAMTQKSLHFQLQMMILFHPNFQIYQLTQIRCTNRLIYLNSKSYAKYLLTDVLKWVI